MTGLDPQLFVRDRFTVLYPELVKAVGSANDALVLAHVHWRTSGDAPYAKRVDGVLWWPGTMDDIGEWTGLSADQAKRSVRKLVDKGYIETTHLRLGGPYDQTYSYRVVLRTMHSAESPHEGAESPLLQGAESPLLPSIENIENNLDALFEEAYSYWPKKVERKSSLSRFKTAVKKLPVDELMAQIKRFGTAYQSVEKRFVPALGVWLNGERWTDELPEPDKRIAAQAAEPKRNIITDWDD